MKRVLSLVAAMVMLMSLFTGCVYTRLEVNINDDLSADARMFTGFEEEMFNSGENGALFGSMTIGSREMHNGIWYVGNTTDYITIDSLDEITELSFESKLFDGSMETMDVSFIKVEYIDGEYRLSFEIGDLTEGIDETSNEVGYTLEEILDSFDQELVYKFPVDMYQTSGREHEGIVVNGEVIYINVLDLVKDYLYNPSGDHYVFSSNPNGSNQSSKEDNISFSDVKNTAWYYEAVTELAACGMVNGMGDGTFVPEGELTMAQFCQMLAKACGQKVGADNSGYWAAKAISYCVYEGFIEDLGAVTKENYDKEITREMAVAGLYRAAEEMGRIIPNNLQYNPNDIPDFDDINDIYKNDILDAYRYCIVSGMDSSGTFAPKQVLTRAQICQLFYNMGWVY